MRKKSWADHILGQSNFPKDEFTWTDGSNYGLDGFHHTQTMGDGVKNHGTVPGATPGLPPNSPKFQSKGISQLPDTFASELEERLALDGVMDDFENGMDLSSMFTEDEGSLPVSEDLRRVASITDLRWLDPTQSPDPDRIPKELLPDRPPLHSLPELEEAWGFGRRHDGLNRVPSQDLDATKYYRDIKSPPPATPGTANSRVEIKDVILKASRRLHYGHDLESIQKEVFQSIESPSLRRAIFAKLQEDHGLAGKVFVRANVFPGLKNGKWVKELKRTIQGAKYLITDDETLGPKLGLQPVKEIPWKAAFSWYQPRLAANGYRIASGDPKEVLRRAFLEGPQRKVHIPKEKPIETMPSDSVTVKQALDVFNRSKPEKRKSLRSSSEVHAKEKAFKKAFDQILKWANEGSLTQEQVFELRASDLSPLQLLKKASLLVSQSPSRNYEGVLQTRVGSVSQPSQLEEVSRFPKLARWLKQTMNEGSMGNELTQLIEARWSPDVRQEGQETIQGLREAHEGLAGAVYVDASAYASKTGYTGCKDGALKHRANPIRTLLAMPRCEGCVHNQRDAKGNSICSVYNKSLVDEVGTAAERKAAQKKNIRMANAPEAEVIASLFTPAGSSIVDEFGLISPMDQEIGLDNLPRTEQLSGILFGDGIDFGEEE